MNETQSSILELLQNYAQCEYPLSLEQIHRMLTVRVDKEELTETLQSMQHQQLISMDKTHDWYVIKGHEIAFRRRTDRIDSSKKKQAILDKFGKLLRFCPWINTIVLTGSLALDNAKESDDIDLMIITAPGTVFLCRIYAFALAKVSGLARKRGIETQPDAICVNIWLDSCDLVVPIQKVSVYSAREIVNARVIMDKNSMFEGFIHENRWIYEKLPNWKQQTKSTEYRVQSTKRLVRALNNLLGRLQLWYMRPHITHEIVSQTQLWFHPKLRS
jgi:predicted nucleotidyltransferase